MAGANVARRRLRILHVAFFGLRAKGVFVHGVPAKLSSAWTRNGHNVFDFSARDVARWAGFGNRWIGRKVATKIFVDLCRSIEPDVLVLGHADIISAEAVAEVRAAMPALKIIQWNVDPIYPRESNYFNPLGVENRIKIMSKAHLCDAIFVSTAGRALEELAADCACPVGFLPNPSDPSRETAQMWEVDDAPFDVMFPGGSEDPRRLVCGELHEMGGLLDGLESNVPGLKINSPGLRGVARAYGPAYQRALSSATIGLNISRHNDLYLYSSDRIAHFAGNGLAVAIDTATGYQDLFSDREFVFFSTLEELTEKLRKLKREPSLRQGIARAGSARYAELFDHQTVAAYMTDVVYGEHDAARYPWPTIVSGEVARAA